MVVDGFWQTDILTDFMKGVSFIDRRSAVVGPFMGPEPGADPAAFSADMRVRMSAMLTGLCSEVLEK
jgi:hypothetical protein